MIKRKLSKINSETSYKNFSL